MTRSELVERACIHWGVRAARCIDAGTASTGEPLVVLSVDCAPWTLAIPGMQTRIRRKVQEMVDTERPVGIKILVMLVCELGL